MYARTHDSEWSQELMQETVLRAMTSISRYDGTCKLAVKEHLEHCGECRSFYEEWKADADSGTAEEELLVLDGFKKIKKRTRRLKLAVAAVSGLLVSLVLAVFFRIYVFGVPLETHLIQVSDMVYNEETESLRIKGLLNCRGMRVTRVVWKQSGIDANAVNVIVYAAEILPFSDDSPAFSIDIPNMKGRKAYFACPEYDLLEVYNWKTSHYELLDQMKEEIYSRIPGWEPTRDILEYSGGITTVNDEEGLSFDVTYVLGEGAVYWRFNDQLITDGDFDPADYEIWISFEEPHQILIYDYQTGEWSRDYSIVEERRPAL